MTTFQYHNQDNDNMGFTPHRLVYNLRQTVSNPVLDMTKKGPSLTELKEVTKQRGDVLKQKKIGRAHV